MIYKHSEWELKLLQTIKAKHEVFYLKEERFIVISIFINN